MQYAKTHKIRKYAYFYEFWVFLIGVKHKTGFSIQEEAPGAAEIKKSGRYIPKHVSNTSLLIFAILCELPVWPLHRGC